MSSNYQTAAIVYAGYAYRQRLESDSALFPVGAQFTAHVRANLADAAPLAILTIGNGLERISDTQLDFTIPASATEGLEARSVLIDFVRTDPDPDVHLQFVIEIPVATPVTRGLA